MKARAPSPAGSAILARHPSTSLRAEVAPLSRSAASESSLGLSFIVLLRHDRACPGHPRLFSNLHDIKTWMPGTSPGMTTMDYGRLQCRDRAVPSSALCRG